MKSFLQHYKIKILLISLIIIICSFGVYFSGNTRGYKFKVPAIDPQENYKIIKTIDGDTFEIKVGKRTVKVRMLGVDTPETLDPRKAVQCFGKEASEKTKELLMGQLVKLKTDSSQGVTDKFGRILAYVYRDDGLFLNRFLLENGYAHEYTYGIPYTMQKEFKDFEREAKEKKNGLWGDVCK